MSAHNIGIYEDLTKIIFELSSNMHLHSSADKHALIKHTEQIIFMMTATANCQQKKSVNIALALLLANHNCQQ